MKYWLTGMLLCMGALAALTVPPRASLQAIFTPSTPRVVRASRSADQQVWRQLDRQRRAVESELDYLAELDQLAEAASLDTDRVTGAWVGLNPELSEGEADEMVGEEAAAFRIVDPRVHIGAVFFSAGRAGDGLRSASVGTNHILRAGGPEPFCFVSVVRFPRKELRSLPFTGFDQPNALGPCAFFGLMGSPGEGIVQWLEGGGYDLGWLYAGWPEGQPFRTRRGFTEEGIGAEAMDRGAYNRDACASGALEVCAELFLSPLDHEVLPSPHEGLYRSPRYVQMSKGVGARGLAILADLRADFGDDAFADFWSSDALVESAFEDAFGISVADWMHAWVLQHYGPLEPGPAPQSGTALLAALWLGLFGVTTTGIVRRRGRTT